MFVGPLVAIALPGCSPRLEWVGRGGDQAPDVDAGPEATGDGGRLDGGPSCLGPFLPDAPDDLPSPTERISIGLVALYELSSTTGVTAFDGSGVAAPLDLVVVSPGTRWSWADPGLSVTEPSRVSSARAATEVREAILASGELSVEAWVTPANLTQGGPARVVSLSRDRRHRSFTLAQEDDEWVWRLRTRGANENGFPEVYTGSGTVVTDGAPHHVVAVYLPTGGHTLYVDGVVQAVAFDCSGIGPWDPTFGLHLVNEESDDRPWLGTVHLVAVYDRALHPEEIAHQLAVGAPDGGDEGDGAGR